MNTKFNICPDRLKEIRKRKGKRFKQEIIALEAGISERQYRNIEKTGKTTRETAEKIAKSLAVDLMALTVDYKENPSGLWVLKKTEHPEPSITIIEPSTISILLAQIEIENQICVKHYQFLENLRCDQTNSKNQGLVAKINYRSDYFSLFISSPDIPDMDIGYEIQPCTISEKGYLWCDATLLEFEQVKAGLVSKALKYSDVIYINDEPLIPEGKERLYKLRTNFRFMPFSDVENDATQSVKYFSGMNELLDHLHAQMNNDSNLPDISKYKYSSINESIMGEPDQFSDFYVRNGSGSYYVILISRVWQDDEEKDHPAPWFFKERDMWTDKITQYLAI